MKEYTITPEQANQRLDKFLMKYLNKAPKGFIYKMLRKKNIKLNGIKAFGGEILAPGDIINIYLSDDTFEKFAVAKDVPERRGALDIIYEDCNLILMNKPAGLLSQPDGKAGDSIVDRMLAYLYNKGEYDLSEEAVFTPGICNRLDRNTTGIVMGGKNLPSLQILNDLSAKRGIVKDYFCIVAGEVKKPGVLKGYIEKDSGANKVSFQGEGKEIETKFEPLQWKNGYSLLRVNLVTGKTHQIRAHMAHRGWPIAGDPKYGDEMVNREFFRRFGVRGQLLHACQLGFGACYGELAYLNGKTFTAPPPVIFSRAAKELFDIELIPKQSKSGFSDQ